MIFFFFNDTATTEIYTLSLHDALPIYPSVAAESQPSSAALVNPYTSDARPSVTTIAPSSRSEEHTSELQSRQYLVCRLLLEKKKPPSLTSIHKKSTNRQSQQATITSCL